MPRITLTANTPTLIASGVAVGPAVYGAPSRDGIGVIVKVPAAGGTIEVDANTPALAVGEGLEVAAGETFADVLAVGEELWAVSAATQEVQYKLSGIPA